MPTATTVQELWGGIVSRSVDGTVWTTIPDVKSVTVPTIKWAKRDRTSLSTSGDGREYGKGRREYGEFVIEVFATKAALTAAIADGARANTWLKVALVDGSIFSAKCIIDWELPLDIDGDSVLKMTGTVSGDVTTTAGV